MSGQRRFDVVVCGSLHRDILVRAAHLPRPDETVPGTGWSLVCGGKGGNQAVHAARQGAATAMLGRVGDDDFGRDLLAHLDAAAVDRREIAIDPAAGSGMSVAILDPHGDYGAVIVSGANLGIDPENVGAALGRLAPFAWLVLQNEVPEAVNLAAATAARRIGAGVLLNAAPARTCGADLLSRVDLLVVNRVEAEMLTGAPVGDAAAAIAALGPLGAERRRVVVTLGGEGLVAAAPGAEPLVMPAMPVTVRSTHGAGDCFIGALAAALARGVAFDAALQCANTAAGRFVGLDPDGQSKAASGGAAPVGRSDQAQGASTKSQTTSQ